MITPRAVQQIAPQTVLQEIFMLIRMKLVPVEHPPDTGVREGGEIISRIQSSDHVIESGK